MFALKINELRKTWNFVSVKKTNITKHSNIMHTYGTLVIHSVTLVRQSLSSIILVI